MDNTSYVDNIGRYELGGSGGNSEGFANLCTVNKMVIGHTIFLHKYIYKSTWISQNHTTENKIDHVYISIRVTRSMEVVRTRRKTRIYSHHL